MKSYLNEYYDELNTIKLQIKKVNSEKIRTDSYNLTFGFMLQILRSMTPFGPISYTNSESSNIYLEKKKSLLELQRDKLYDQIHNMEKNKKCILLTDLSYAVTKGDAKQVIKLANMHNINYKDDLGNTALHYAVKHKHYNIMEILLVEGANPNIKNDHQISPIDMDSYLKELVQHNNELRAVELQKVLSLPYEVGLIIAQFEGYSPKSSLPFFLDSGEIGTLGEVKSEFFSD
ncbi:MAG: ankyrin repeat domain-containing protein [Rickettsiales bacterium]|nr:ankyrin repeat domain-containing protein [Rickettsiales bacterium]